MRFMRKYFFIAVLLTSLSPTVAQSATPVGSASAEPRNGIESLIVSKSGGSTVLKLEFREVLAVPPSHFSIAKPARLVFDFPDTGNGLGYSTKTINEGGVRSLNIVQSGDRSRLVLNLDKLARFETRQEGKALLIALLPEGDAGTVASTAVQHFAGNEKAEPQSIRDIKFRRSQDGAGVVVVDLSAGDIGVDIHQKGTGLFVSFKKTQIPEQLRRQLDVVDFATPVTKVNAKADGDNVSMEIVPKGLWEHTAFQSDNQFIVEVRPVKEDPNKLFQGSKTGYQGEAISLNFQNIPLRELLHVFADITNFNIVISDSVAGNVSLRLNDVAWDHALEIVLQQKNLAMRKSGNVLWIAPRDELAARDKLEVEARDAAVAAEVPRLEVFQLHYQKAEEFSTMLSAGGGAQGAGQAPSAAPTGGGFLSAVGRVTIDKRTNQVFIYDVPTKLELIRGLISQIDRPARQVLIEARIVEADTSFNKKLGARVGVADPQGLNKGHSILGSNTPRWGIAGSQESINYHIPENNVLPVMTHSVSGQLIYDQIGTASTGVGGTNLQGNNVGGSNLVNLPVAGAAGQFALALFNSSKTQLLTLELSALEADGDGKTISSPRILTADQVEATIHDGEKIPYLCASSSGATSICWANAFLVLKVKPQITPDGRVLMTLKINKDARGTEVGVGALGTMPTVKSKEISSEVHVENGGTIVIGGVFELIESNQTTRVPFFGDLPYVGFMFKNKQRSEIKRELIIMITPKVVDDALATKM